MTVLSVRDLSVRYGGVDALSGVDLDVHAGRLVGLIGPNGAGKTTFIDAVTGFTRCRGHIELMGADITRTSPYGRVRQGLARTWQSNELFDDLSVEENLAVAGNRDSWWDRARAHSRDSPRKLPRRSDSLTPWWVPTPLLHPTGRTAH